MTINDTRLKPIEQMGTHIKDSEGQRHSWSSGLRSFLRGLILNVTFPLRVPLDSSSLNPRLRFEGTGSRWNLEGLHC